MFSATQIRAVQGVLSQAASLAPSRMAEMNGLLDEQFDRSATSKIGDLRCLSVTTAAGDTRALFLSARPDPNYLRRMILADAQPPAAFHLDLPARLRQPGLIALHFIRQKPLTAYYLLFGAVMTYRNTDFEYSRLRRISRDAHRLAEVLYALNTPVEELPYPKGRKLATIGIFKKMGVRYVGDIVRQDPEILKTRLGAMDWISIQSMLRRFNLIPGESIPEWRPPKST